MSSLNVEAGFLSKLIYTGDKKTLAEEQIKPQLFTGTYRNAYKFILNHITEHGTVPSIDVVRRYFPTIELLPKKKVKREPLSWWASELRRKAKHNRLADMVEKVADFLEEMNPEKAMAVIEGTLRDITTVATKTKDLKLEAFAKVLKEEYKRIEKTGGMVGLSSTFQTLDRILGGFDKGELVSIIARPNTGKTWVLLILLFNIWKQGFNVALGTREMSVRQMATRFMSLYTKLPYDRLRRGKLTKKERKKYFKALVEVSQKKNQFVIFYIEGGVTYLRTKIEEYKPDILGVDGMYLMDDDLGATEDQKRVTNITRGLKALAMASKIPVIGTGQANRATMKKTGPELDNASFSDSVGQDSDVVIGLHQTEEMRNDQELELRILKARESCRGRLMITFDFDNMNFEEIYGDAEFDNGSEKKERPKKKSIRGELAEITGKAPKKKKMHGTPPPSVRKELEKKQRRVS